MIDGPGISTATKNAWQAIEFNQTRRDVNGTFAVNPGLTTASQASTIQNQSSTPGSPNTSIFLGTNPKVAVRANGAHIGSVNVSTKLQQQILTLPDGQKNSSSVKSRHSPRDYNEGSQQRKYQF